MNLIEGEVLPPEWSSSPLKYLGEVENSGVWGEDTSFLGSVEVKIPTTRTIRRNGTFDLEGMEVRHLNQHDHEKFLCQTGDIVVVKSSGSSENVISGKCGLVRDRHNFSFGNFLMRFRPNPTVLDPTFIFFFLISNITRQRVLRMVSSTTYPNLKVNEYVTSKVPLPPFQEQKLISQYLDKKTSQIDSLVEKIQKKIELLKEQRTSLIDHVVTKGLNPNVEMKDSSIEWVDRIPKNWSKSRLDFLCKLYGRLGWKSLKSDEYVDEGYVFLSTPNIKDWDIDFVNVNYITEERYLESPEIMLEENDVLLVKDGSTLGITNYVRTLPRPSTVNSSIGVLKTTSNQLLPEFLFWFLSGNYIQNVIQRIKGGMGVPHLFQSDIKKFVVFLPPMDEQLEICHFLNHQIPKLNELIERHLHKINCYKEYRQSLISSVVTGKVRVTEDMI